MTYTIANFDRFCSSLILENGSKMVLEPFQRLILQAHFKGATETVIILSKKNGKTTLLAALALFHLQVIPEAEVVIGASSRDQARILFRQAAGLVRRSKLEDVFDVKSGYGEVRLKGGTKDEPRIRVLAADANTGDGVIPTLALVDELHRHPSAELYGIFRDGLDARDGQMITISTAGATLDSPLGALRAEAHELPSFHRNHGTKYNYASSADGSFAFHEWCLDSTEDVDDIALVKLANLATWQTETKLRRRHDSPSMTPWRWKRFACGIWTEGEEPWIDPVSWDVLAYEDLELYPQEKAWLAVDVGVRHDSTAIVTVVSREGKFAVEALILKPPKKGSLPLERVENEIRNLCQEFDVRGVAYDPWTFRRSAEMLEADKIPMVEFPQSPERMASASANLYHLIESRGLVHNGDNELRSHVLAGVTKETERGWRLQKDPKMSRPIDALIALAMAALIATADKPMAVWAAV